VPGVVLDARAVAELLDHLQVVLHTLLKALGLDELVLGVERREALDELGANRRHGLIGLRLGGDVVGGRVDAAEVERLRGARRVSGSMTEIASTSSPQSSTRRSVVLLVRGEDLDDVAPGAEGAPVEVHVVAGVLNLDELTQDGLAAHPLAFL
jgi:hypothetical protein